MPSGPRRIGDFCWINVLSSDHDNAREFFSKLLGWTFPEMPGMGYRIQVDGKDIGGLFPFEGPNTPPGTSPGIGVMVHVQSADDAGARARSLGGTANSAFDVGPQGRMADCHDPFGASLDVWQPAASAGMEADSSHHGTPSWFECMTTDAAKAVQFYCDWFGWTSRTMPMGDFDYTVFSNAGVDIAGLMPISPSMGPVPAHWGVYITVNDADAAAKLAAELGGTMFIPPTDIPNTGRFSGLISPQGVRFYVLSYSA